MSKAPWLRKIKVTLGPLEEWKGSTAGECVTFTSDGTMNGLRVVGTFNKTVMGTPNPSVIQLYNLGREARNGIKASLTKVTVEAGWQNTDMRLVFQGSVMNVYNERNGADIITKLTAIPGYGSFVRGVSSFTFAAGTPVKEAATRIAKDFPGMRVNDSNFNGLAGTIGAGGWSYAGSTKEGMTKLSEEYGFSWSISDGQVTAIGDKVMLPDFVELNGQASGLISISPVVNGPMQIETGVKIKALYMPGITVGSSVKVNSDLNPRLNGTYRINTLNISIDAYSESWTMDIDSLRYGGGASNLNFLK